jgi:hypothetical protein
MSDSGFTGPPPVTPPAASELRPPRGDVLKIVDTTGMMRTNARLQRIAGEIVAENKDGTLRIATPQGDITVPRPASRPDMIVGAKIEMDVPPGNPPRQITVREVTPPPQQPARNDAPAPDTPPPAPPIIAAPPRPPVSIPEQPAPPPPQNAPAPVTAEQIIRLLPLPSGQAAQIIVPPVDIIDTLLPAIPPAIITAQNAPQELADELLRAVLTTPVPQTATQQIANVIVPQLPPSTYVTPAPIPGGLPPAVQTTAQQLVSLLQTLNMPAAMPAQAPAPSPLMIFTPRVAAAPQTTAFSLLPAKLPPAMAAFAALAPENLIQAPPAGAPPSPTAAIMPKMDARIVALSTPAVTIAAPGIPTAPQSNGNPFMPSLGENFANAPAVPAGMLAAQVRGITAQHFPVLSVSFPAIGAMQDFVMQFPANAMEPGASVTIMPQPGTPAPAVMTAAATAALPFTPLPELMTPGLWPALDDAFQALQIAAPQTAHIMAQTAIPNTAAAPKMPAVIMMFVAAMQGGDLQNWLGEKSIDTLRRIGKADVVSRIGRDAAAIARLTAADAPAQDWRSVPVPMMWDNHIHKIMLHYRPDRDASKDGAEKKKGTRFVLDIAPPRMGNVQLDGLHRPGDSNGRLDLIVRTKENLSAPMQQAMRRLYVHALEQAQLSGELSFQNKSGNWINIS